MTGTTDQMDVLQRIFITASPFGDMLRTNAGTFWENQEKILASMEHFASGWFERRHTGTREALAAAQRMCEAETPVDFMRAYQEWASGAFGRVIADGLACQQDVMTALGALTQQTRAAATGKEVERQQPLGKSPARSEAA